MIDRPTISIEPAVVDVPVSIVRPWMSSVSASMRKLWPRVARSVEIEVRSMPLPDPNSSIAADEAEEGCQVIHSKSACLTAVIP